MPHITGLQILLTIRKEVCDSKDAYVIMVTSRKDKKDVVQAKAVGANDYIVKPIVFKTVEEKINIALSSMNIWRI